MAWAEDLAERLSEGSKHAYHGRRDIDESIDFRYVPAFESFKNAYQGWEALDEDLLSESLFFSLAHLLEAKTDLDCSIELMATFYYRQAFVSLRTFIEDVLLPVYFLEDREEYKKWKAGSARVPNIRGKDGVISFLRKAQRIKEPNLAKMDTLYERLNGFVHGRPETLIHSGTCDGEWRGHSFKQSACMEWLDAATECINTAIVIMKQHTDHWWQQKRLEGLICDVCHETDFERKLESMMKDGPLYKYTCRQCGSGPIRRRHALTLD